MFGSEQTRSRVCAIMTFCTKNALPGLAVGKYTSTNLNNSLRHLLQ